MKIILMLSFLLIGFGEQSIAQERHPHILVNSEDKTIVLNKIKGHVWAADVFKQMEN